MIQNSWSPRFFWTFSFGRKRPKALYCVVASCSLVVIFLTSSSHIGTPAENHDWLQTFGIPTEGLPLKENDPLKLRTDSHSKWIVRREVKERFLITHRPDWNFPATDLPAQGDVLFGRGLTYHQHPGNRRLRYLVEELLDVYNSLSDRRDKTILTTKVAQTIIRSPHRFLKRDTDGWWWEVGESEAREKISVNFRTCKGGSVAA